MTACRPSIPLTIFVIFSTIIIHSNVYAFLNSRSIRPITATRNRVKQTTTRNPPTEICVLPPDQGIPVLVGILAYPTFLIYKNTIGSNNKAAGTWEEEPNTDAATLASSGTNQKKGSIGRALKWSKLINVPPPPYVRMCVGQDCTKDGAPDAWTMVREVAPAGVSVLPVNCLGPCGMGPCGQAYAAEPDAYRKCPQVLSEKDGFYDSSIPPPPPAILPTGLVKPRLAEGRKRLTKTFISTEVKTPADARVLFRGMGYADSELYGGKGFVPNTTATNFEVSSTRQGLLDLNRVDNITLQRIGYAAIFIWASGRFQNDGGADVVFADGLPPVPVWIFALAFFGLTQIISVDPDENTYRPSQDDLDNTMPYS